MTEEELDLDVVSYDASPVEIVLNNNGKKGLQKIMFVKASLLRKKWNLYYKKSVQTPHRHFARLQIDKIPQVNQIE